MTPSATVLVTSSRMPFALDIIRKLGKTGHRVVAADTFSSAPGLHSKYTAVKAKVASPRYETDQYITDVKNLIDEHDVDLLIPGFEDVFYIAAHIERLQSITNVFCAPFEALSILHDKVRFLRLAEELGLYVPKLKLATNRDELIDATEEIGDFFARPAYSRGGVDLFTNTGPLAGEVKLDDIKVSPAFPWIVQRYMDGEDVCTASVVHNGEVAAHSAYVHPREIDHAGGIVFNSIDEPETLEATRAVVEKLGYTGHIAFDFMRTDEGLAMVECNPRPTLGIAVMSPRMYVEGLFEHESGDETQVAEAGRSAKISIALVRDMVLNWDEIPKDLPHLLSSTRDIYAEPGDSIPLLYTLLSYGRVMAFRFKAEGTRSDLMAAYFDDLLWNGDDISPAAGGA